MSIGICVTIGIVVYGCLSIVATQIFSKED